MLKFPHVSKLLFIAFVCLVARADNPPTVVSTGEIFSTQNVDPYDRDNDYGFNHAPSVTRLSDGKLLCVWFSGPFEASVHQVLLGCYSSDEGTTWGKGVVLNDQPRRSDFDPAFITDGNRTYLFYSVGRWNRYPFVGGRDVEKTEVGIDSFKIYLRTTEDNGATWSKEERIGDFTGTGPRSNGIKLSTGELILPMHNYPGQQVSVLKRGPADSAWRRILAPKTAENANFAEPCIAECKSGQLLMVLRTRDGWLWTSRSTDKGETWSEFAKTDLPAAASSASIVSLADGRLALTHNPSKPPLRTPLTLRLSNDEGQTWGEPIQIASIDAPTGKDDVYSRQVAYPSVIQLPEGDLFVVWTQISISPSAQSGKICWARVQVK